MENKTAQDLINEVEIERRNRIADINEFRKMFYPEVWKQEQADKNISKCLKEMKIQKKQRLFPMETYGTHGELRLKGIPRLRPNFLAHSQVRRNSQ